MVLRESQSFFEDHMNGEHSENSDICSEKDFFEKISSNNFVKISKHLPKDDVSPCSLKSPFSSKSLISEDWFDFQDQQFSPPSLPSIALIDSTVQQVFSSYPISKKCQPLQVMNSTNLGVVWDELSKAQLSNSKRVSWHNSIFQGKLTQSLHVNKPFSLTGELKSQYTIKLPTTI